MYLGPHYFGPHYFGAFYFGTTGAEADRRGGWLPEKESRRRVKRKQEIDEALRVKRQAQEDELFESLARNTLKAFGEWDIPDDPEAPIEPKRLDFAQLLTAPLAQPYPGPSVQRVANTEDDDLTVILLASA